MTVYDAFGKFKKTFLLDKKSIFSDEEILTPGSIEYLKKNFIQNGLGGKESFIDKIKEQLIKKPKAAVNDDDIPKQALEVLAHAVWLWRLPPINSSTTGRLDAVNEVLGLIDEDAKVKISSQEFKNWFENVSKGFAATGTYYNTNKPFELAYLIEFFGHFLASEQDAISFLSSKRAGSGKQIIQDNEKEVEKTVSVRNALLHLIHPDKYFPILSNGHKELIVEAFDGKVSIDDEQDIDEQLACIKNELIKLFPESAESVPFFYSQSIRPLWDKESLPIESNTIYYGPPGTGKTYLTLQAVKARVVFESGLQDIEESYRKQICQVQFHPSFSYEDFIDGLKPSLQGQNVHLKLKNGIFKQFCIDATKALKDARQVSAEPPKFYFVIDEINRADLSAVFGEVLSCLEEDKRIDFDGDGVLSKGLVVSTQNAYLIENPDDAVYVEKDSNGNERYLFGIPINVVLIGTMNDIDRSVDTFDFALRRRFTWVYKGFDEDVLANALSQLDIDRAQGYIDACKNLNKFISNDLGLGRSYEIGHAYFMKLDSRNEDISKQAKERLFDRHLSPLIEEYLRSEHPAKELAKKVGEARNIFLGSNK
jgi:hypothetical protein